MFLSHNDARRIHCRVRLAQRRDDAVPAPFRRPEIHEQHLVLHVVDNFRQFGAAPRQFHRRELAFEYGVLQMVAKPAHRLINLAQALVITNVVTDQVRDTHADLPSDYRTVNACTWQSGRCYRYCSGEVKELPHADAF